MTLEGFSVLAQVAASPFLCSKYVHGSSEEGFSQNPKRTIPQNTKCPFLYEFFIESACFGFGLWRVRIIHLALASGSCPASSSLLCWQVQGVRSTLSCTSDPCGEIRVPSSKDKHGLPSLLCTCMACLDVRP